MSKQTRPPIALVLAVGLLAVGCGGGGHSSDGSDGAGDVPATAPEVADTAADGVPADTAQDDARNDSADGAGPDAEAGADLPPLGPSMSYFPLSARHLVGDRARQRLYLSLDGAQLEHGNTILVLDARTGSTITAIPIGSNPDVMALSADGSTLWVGIDGALAIRRVTLSDTPPTVGPLIKLATQNFGQPPVAADISVLAGSATSIAVSVLGTNKIVVLDDGVARPMAAPQLGGLTIIAGPPGYLFAFNNHDTGFQFYTLPVTSSGLGAMPFPNLISGFGNVIHYQDGRIFAESGDIIDVTDPTHPALAGMLDSPGTIANAGPHRLVMLPNNGNSFSRGPLEIRVIDIEGKKAIATIDLNSSLRKATAAGVTDVTFMGGNTLAFLGFSGDGITMPRADSLVIVHHALLAAAD
jgi:hypothetical protein